MTKYIILDIVIIAIFVAATLWYIQTAGKDIVNLFKKKYYTLYIYHEGEEKFKKVATYKERSMRNAITEHFLSYNGNATLSHFKTITDYNENTMRYFLSVDGDAYLFTMLREVDGAKVEQR